MDKIRHYPFSCLVMGIPQQSYPIGSTKHYPEKGLVVLQPNPPFAGTQGPLSFSFSSEDLPAKEPEFKALG